MEENKRKKGSIIFPLIPIYEDPSNWNQQQPHELGTNTSNLTRSDNDAIQLSPIALSPELVPNLFAPIPSSLTPEQVRLTRVLHPESGLKCPRCDSTNTKFCYFNNYSLSQPRHFCRTCRRYWTRGGTLRNVSVGGGSRRTKNCLRASTSTATSAQTGRHAHINTNSHHIGMSPGIGIGFSGMQLQFRQFSFTGAFEIESTTHLLPTQLCVSSHLGFSSKNEELLVLGVCMNAGVTSMGSNRAGSQGSLPSVVSSSCGNVFQQHSLLN